MIKEAKQIFSNKLPLREVAPAVQPRDVFISTGRSGKMTQDAYISKFGTQEEKAELARRIEQRRAKLPKFVYLICMNCGRKEKHPYGDRDIYDPSPEFCFFCNPRRYVDGGKFREMKKAEATKFDADEEAKRKAANARTVQAAFFMRNQERGQAGLLPLTLEQFKEERKKEYRQLIRDSRGGQKR